MFNKIIKNSIINYFKQNTRLLTNISSLSSKINAVTTTIQETSTAATVATGNLLLNFSTVEQQKILEIINAKDLALLLSYNISKVRATNLLDWQQRNGDLSRIEDILQINGFGTKIADKFYRSLLEAPKAKKTANPLDKQRGNIAAYITPTIDVILQKQIRTSLAVCIGVTSASWSRLELSTDDQTPCQLTHWQHYDIVSKKLHLNDLVHRCLYVNELIPEADCYIFESPQMAQVSAKPGNVEQQNINIQKSQMTALFAYALTLRNYKNTTAETNTPSKVHSSNVFYLRRMLTARLFSHLVGTERVSNEQTILNMMRTYYNIENLKSETNFAVESVSNVSLRGNVQFPQDLREMFAKAERVEREFLGQSLLLNLAFVRLILLRDAVSIAKLASKNNKVNVENIAI